MHPLIVLAIVAAIVVLGVIAQKLGWVDFSDKRHSGSGGGGGLGGVDEVFNPTRHEAQIELDRQTILPAPAPLAGDGEFGISDVSGVSGGSIYNGRVQIDLRNHR